MINSELIRNAIKNPSFYGITLAFIGAVGIFAYSIYSDANLWKQKEDGEQFISIQLSAFAPPSKDPIAEKVEQPKYHHKPRQRPKKHEVEATPKPEPSPLQAVEKPQPEVVEKVEEITKEVVEETQEAKTPTTTQSNPDAVAQENIKIMRYADGVENEFLQAIHRAVQKKHIYPPFAIQRGYEGKVFVKFLIDVSGAISRLEVIKTSRYSLLDKAALKTLKRACKDFPKPHEKVYIEIPIVYNLQH